MKNLNEEIKEKIKELDAEFEERGAIRTESLVAAFRAIATASLEACDKEWEQWLSNRKEELETYAEWLDTRLMNGDWPEKTEFKNEEEVRMKIGRNLCQAEQIDEVLAAVSEQKKLMEEYLK